MLKSTKVDVQGSSAVIQVYVDKSRHSFIALCSEGLYKHIQHWEQNEKNYSAPIELSFGGGLKADENWMSAESSWVHDERRVLVGS